MLMRQLLHINCRYRYVTSMYSMRRRSASNQQHPSPHNCVISAQYSTVQYSTAQYTAHRTAPCLYCLPVLCLHCCRSGPLIPAHCCRTGRHLTPAHHKMLQLHSPPSSACAHPAHNPHSCFFQKYDRKQSVMASQKSSTQNQMFSDHKCHIHN